MPKRKWSLFPRVVLFIAFIAVELVSMRPANAQIFGSVGFDGAIMLSNNPSDAGLHLIVANNESVERGTKNAASAPAIVPIDSSRFSAIIAEASRISQVPQELLKAVIAVESRFNPKAVSKKGARGLMQLMPQTAKRFSAGDMLNPRDNVLAGARYLRFLLDLFKWDIELALAGYNAGENAVIRAGYRIPAFAETQLYVPTVMAHYGRFLAPA
jgi:soluble lytic murein transglycosylase-like protein